MNATLHLLYNRNDLMVYNFRLADGQLMNAQIHHVFCDAHKKTTHLEDRRKKKIKINY